MSVKRIVLAAFSVYVLNALPCSADGLASMAAPGALPLACQDRVDPDVPLTLWRSVDIALCNNTRLRQAWIGIALQTAQVQQAEAAGMPSASMTVTRLRTRTDGGHGSSQTGSAFYGTLGWRLFDFGAREAELAAQNALLAAAVTARDATMRETVAGAIGAYSDLQAALAHQKNVEKSVTMLEALYGSVQRRELAGVVAGNDLLQIETALARALMDRSSATVSVEQARANLSLQLGLPAAIRLQPVEADTEPAADSSRSLDDWFHAICDQHPALRGAEQRVQAAVSKLAATRTETWPSLDLLLNFNQNGYPGQALSEGRSRVSNVGVSISVPLFDGTAHRARMEQRQQELALARSQAEEIELKLKVDVVKAYYLARAGQANLAASARLLDAAERFMASADRRYGAGAADISEVLNAGTSLAGAEQERSRVLIEWQSARLALLSLSGELLAQGASLR